MATVSKLLALLNGLPASTDLTTSDLVTNSVWVGGTTSSPSVQVTTTLLNSFLTSVTAGSGISVTGSAPSQTVAVDSTVVRTNGANAFTADQSFGGFKATNVADPVSAQDAATKNYVDTHSGTASTALDGTFRIENTTDTTKKIAFDASGITTATTRTITMPDSAVDLGKVGTAIQKDGSVTFTADQPMGTHKLTGLSAGSGAGDSVRYEQAILTSGANAFGADQSMGSHKLTNLAAPTTNGDALRYDELGAANGIATLDSGGKVPAAQLPSTLMNYKGAWDASTNTPTLADGTGTNGDVYRASVAGTQDLGSGSQTWAVGDLVIYNGSIWQHSPAADGVSSVNGATGTVTVNAINQLTGDVTTTAASGSQSKAATVAAIAGTTVSGTTGTGNVVFSASPTLTGTLTAATISASGTVTGSNLSGTNTGDQTITLTGDVTGSGTGSFATTIASNAVTASKIATSAFDGTTITGGGGSAAAVQYAPSHQMVFIAGEAFAANTSFLVRIALTGETAGRVYKADASSAAANGKFWAMGILAGGAGVSAGNSVTVMLLGSWTLGSSDSAFASGDIGKPVWLNTSGGFTTTAPSTSGYANYKVGVVLTTTTMLLDSKQLTAIV